MKELIVTSGTQELKSNKKCIMLKDEDLDENRVADDLNYLFNHGDIPLYYTLDEKKHIVREIENNNPDRENLDMISKYKI